MDDESAQRRKAHKLLVDIASVSKRLHSQLARENVNLQQVSARTRLDKIIVAVKSILAKLLGDASDTSDSFDPRLEDWLCSKEPDMCLHILKDMERLIASDLGGKTLWGKVSSAVHSMYPEGRINEAINLFNDRQDFFHFLLTPEVWNCEIGNRSQVAAFPDIAKTVKTKGFRRVEQNDDRISSEALDSVLQWLDGFNCSEKHEYLVPLRQPDTCEWLPHTPHYGAWRNSDDSFLWLQGKAGAGKTVLASSVIEGIRKTLQDGEHIVFFYCDFRDERTTSAAAVLRSILSQFLRKLRNGTGRDLSRLVNDMFNGQADGTLVLKQTSTVTPFVSRAAKQFSRQPFVVIDALDECQEIESLLHALRELANGGMRLFVTSRPLQMITDKLRDLPFISMNRMVEVSADIRLHITRSIDADRRLRVLEGQLKVEILDTLQDKADGMFRWVQCQIDTLKKCATARDIRLALRSLPTGLDETYERILRAIDLHSSDGKVALRALVWLVAALRPLRLVEILDGLSINLQKQILDREIAPVHEHALLDALGSLVVYYEENDVINLSHFSVKEYLIGALSLTNLPMYHIEMQTAHAQVALLCMCYIAAVINHWAPSETKASLQISSDQETDIVPIISKSHPLLRYAFQYGFRHIQFLDRGYHPAIDGMITLRSEIERHPVEWQLVSKLATLPYPFPPGLPPAAEHDFIICILISSLPERFLHSFLRRAHFKAFPRTSPLVYATYFNKIEHARILLSYSASNVNGAGLSVTYSSRVRPLKVAFYYWRHSILELFLLDWEATVPPWLYSFIFYDKDLVHNTRDSVMLLQHDGFAEWVTDGQCGQSLLHALGEEIYLFVRSAPEKEIVALLRRFSQLGWNSFGPDSLELVLGIVLSAVSRRSISMVQNLCSLDMPIPSRALSVGRTQLVQRLTSQGHDMNAIMTRGNFAFHDALGECQHGSSCWSPSCNLCSIFLRVVSPPSDVADVLFVGTKGAGKSSLINMILDVPDDSPSSTQVNHGSTTRISSYATFLWPLPVQIWDTPGFDKTSGDHYIRDEINDWLPRVTSSHDQDSGTGHGSLSPAAQLEVVWCMHAREIGDPVFWRQFQTIYQECSRRSVSSIVLINQVPTGQLDDWEVQCEERLGRLGLSAGRVLLHSVRSHQGEASAEYKDDSLALSLLICQTALHNRSWGDFFVRLGHHQEFYPTIWDHMKDLHECG